MFLLPMLIGCFASKSVIDFNPTNSMCLDATVANMHSAGCYEVSVEKTVYGVVKVVCNDARKSFESDWTSNEFYGIAFGSSIPDDVSPICTDPFLIMTMKSDEN
tara:strand:+ start:10047 stop:10358 length:312 start_codon:yes stop_codon:yes gene_type:complete